MKILIVDDHTVVRAGLHQILADQPEMKLGEVSTGAEAIDQVRKSPWDMVILDLTLPDKNGLEVLKEMKKIRADLPVLILTMHPEDQFATRALKAGAAGYMTKESAAKELVNAIKKVTTGGKYITPQVAERLAAEVSSAKVEYPHQLLSDREFEVLRLIASGKTVGEIAHKLFLSVKTVSTYRTRILEKMEMNTNAELIYYAVQEKLV